MTRQQFSACLGAFCSLRKHTFDNFYDELKAKNALKQEQRKKRVHCEN